MYRLAANTLRRTTVSRTNAVSTNTRSLVTSAQKRALQKDQIGGEAKSAAKPAKPPTKTATPPPPPGGSGGGGGGTLPLMGGLAAVVGGAYYMDLIPKDLIPSFGKDEEVVKEEVKTDRKVEIKVEKESEPAPAPVEKKVEVAKPKAPDNKAKVETEEKSVPKSEALSEGNRVRSIDAFSVGGRTSEAVAVTEHPSGGNRVTVEALSPKTPEAAPPANEASTVAAAVEAATDAAEAEKELSTPGLGKSPIDEELAKAHAVMKATVDETYLKGLEDLSAGELRVRVVQLSSEMNERAKWEAVRLREFLGMKEKEVGEK